jgi:hypothetical protein
MALDARRISSAPITPVTGSRSEERIRASASMLASPPTRWRRAAWRSAAGARSSPRDVPEQSSGASITVHGAVSVITSFAPKERD